MGIGTAVQAGPLDDIMKTCNEHRVWTGIFAASAVAASSNKYLPLRGVSAIDKAVEKRTCLGEVDEDRYINGHVKKWEAYCKDNNSITGYEIKTAWLVSWRAIGAAGMAASGSALGYYFWQNLKK